MVLLPEVSRFAGLECPGNMTVDNIPVTSPTTTGYIYHKLVSVSNPSIGLKPYNHLGCIDPRVRDLFSQVRPSIGAHEAIRVVQQT